MLSRSSVSMLIFVRVFAKVNFAFVQVSVISLYSNLGKLIFRKRILFLLLVIIK